MPATLRFTGSGVNAVGGSFVEKTVRVNPLYRGGDVDTNTPPAPFFYIHFPSSTTNGPRVGVIWIRPLKIGSRKRSAGRDGRFVPFLSRCVS